MQEIGKAVKSNVYLADNFSDLTMFLEKINIRTLWVVDTNTARLVRPLPEAHVIIGSNEGSKSLKSVQEIITAASDRNFSRTDTFVAMGGGLVTDTVAFAASIYKRGCRLLLIPSTLLAMTDASIGGKTAVNFSNTKNLIGTFYPANDVIICPDYLKSLPEKTYKCGLAEIIKASFLTKNDDLMKELVLNKDKILSRDMETLKRVITLSVRIKCAYVNNDPCEEKGIRKALNFGHTFGHALESLKRMNVTHGEAVAWGMAKAAKAALDKRLCDEDLVKSLMYLLSVYGFDTAYRINPGDWNEYRRYLFKDKKIKNGALKFILLKEQGRPIEAELDEALLKSIVADI